MQNCQDLKNKGYFFNVTKSRFVVKSCFMFIKVTFTVTKFKTLELSKKEDFLWLLLTVYSSEYIFKSTFTFYRCI